MYGAIVWVRDGLAPIPLLILFALVCWTGKMCDFTPFMEARGVFIFWELYYLLCLSGVFSRRMWATILVGGVDNFKTEQEFLLVVPRPSTWRKKIWPANLSPQCLCLDLGTRFLLVVSSCNAWKILKLKNWLLCYFLHHHAYFICNFNCKLFW